MGHGTSLNDNSAVAAKHQVEVIRALDRYAAVLNVYMEEPPLVSDWLKLTKRRNVVVVPFFISDGLHSYEDIPALLGIDEALWMRNPAIPITCTGDHSTTRPRSAPIQSLPT